MKLFYKAIDNYDRERYQYLNLDLIDVLYFRINKDTEDYQINVNGTFHNVDYATFKKIKQCFQELAQEDEEDREDIKIAEERLADIDSGKAKPLTQDQLNKMIDGWGFRNTANNQNNLSEQIKRCKYQNEETILQYIRRLQSEAFNHYERTIKRMEKDNIINKLQSNPWDPRTPQYNEKGELTSVTIEFKKDESDDKEAENQE